MYLSNKHGNYGLTFFQICQYFPFAGHICCLLQLDLCQRMGLEMYIFMWNLKNSHTTGAPF